MSGLTIDQINEMEYFSLLLIETKRKTGHIWEVCYKFAEKRCYICFKCGTRMAFDINYTRISYEIESCDSIIVSGIMES